MLTSPEIVHKPPRLPSGGKIGVVTPAGPVDEESLAAGIDAIRREGFAVELARGIRQQKGYLAGDEKSRADDIKEFFTRGDIHAVFCARGGFGSVQLLPHLNLEFRKHTKIFVGYSDITVLLNWFWQEHGMVTFHAPMVAMDIARGLNRRSKEYFWGTLTGAMTNWQVALGETIRPGTAEAVLIGGCLSLLVTSLGTPYEINTDGSLLFLEDVGERPYRIERMLTHLKMAGKLNRPAGVILGDFTNCQDDGPRGVRQVVGELFEKAPYPVVMGLAAGHGSENVTLPLGVKALLDSQNGTLSLTESPLA